MYGHLISELKGDADALLDELVTSVSIKLHTTVHKRLSYNPVYRGERYFIYKKELIY